MLGISSTRRACHISFLLQCFIALIALSRGETDVEHPECRLYLAESTIPGGEE